jgi:hypothetical protein
MAFIPRNTPFEPGHSVADVCYGQIETCAASDALAQRAVRPPPRRGRFRASAGGDADDAGIAFA